MSLITKLEHGYVCCTYKTIAAVAGFIGRRNNDDTARAVSRVYSDPEFLDGLCTTMDQRVRWPEALTREGREWNVLLMENVVGQIHARVEAILASS
jgi:hypothetical protein